MQEYGGDQNDDMLTPSINIHNLNKTENRCNRRAKDSRRPPPAI